MRKLISSQRPSIPTDGLDNLHIAPSLKCLNTELCACLLLQDSNVPLSELTTQAVKHSEIKFRVITLSSDKALQLDVFDRDF